jgi:hypothetical protein
MNVDAQWQGIARSRCLRALAVVGILALYFALVPRPTPNIISSPRVTFTPPPYHDPPLVPAVRNIQFDRLRLRNGLQQPPEMSQPSPLSTDLIDTQYKPDFDPGKFQ